LEEVEEVAHQLGHQVLAVEAHFLEAAYKEVYLLKIET
jgi:hypothetical protein